MNRQEFTNEFHVILDVYGDKNYPPIRRELIYDYVKNLNVDELRQGINSIIGNEKYSPMLDDFKKYFNNIIQTKNKNHIEEISKENNCIKCNCSGVVLVKQAYGVADNAYQCNCYVGKKFFSHFPKLFLASTKQIN